MKPNLSTTTLICVDCLNADRAIKVLERCKSLCDFAEVKLLTSLPTDYIHKVEIQPITTLVHYSVFMLKRIHEFVNTEKMLVVQRDGWILNPDKWNPSWEQYDYIGALFNQYDKMGVGGFSFRSKKLMESVSQKYPPFNNTDQHAAILQQRIACYEDGEIAITYKNVLEQEGFKFAPLDEGAKFSSGGNPNMNYYVSHPFGFHGTYRPIDQVTGRVAEHLEVVNLPEPL